MRIDEIRLLMAIDAALASTDGLHVPTFAQTHNRSPKTIMRALASLTEIGHAHTSERQDDGRYVHRYLRGVEPLFRSTPKPDGRLRPARNDGRGRPRLSLETRQKIIRRLDAGETAQQIADSGLAGYGTIYRISRERADVR